jgi:hypothetical protein
LLPGQQVEGLVIVARLASLRGFFCALLGIASRDCGLATWWPETMLHRCAESPVQAAMSTAIKGGDPKQAVAP